MESGDHIAEVKRFLKEAPMMAVTVQNLTDEIAELEAFLADESIAAARYGVDAIGGGVGELTATEAAAARRVKMERRIIDLRHRIAAIERRRKAIDRAVNVLQDDEREIIRARMAGLSWVQVSVKLGFAERSCQHKYKAALSCVAKILFGEWG